MKEQEQHAIKKTVADLLVYSFRVLLLLYIVSILFEVVFPGFTSNYIRLDWFLWVVILWGFFAFLIKRIK